MTKRDSKTEYSNWTKRRLALEYLAEMAHDLKYACDSGIKNDDVKSVNNDVAEQMGKMFSAMKEVAETLQLVEEHVEGFAYIEYQRRQTEK